MKKTLESFCTQTKGLPASKLSVQYSSKYSRKLHPEFDGEIDNLWDERMKENIVLFDKSKFRLHDYTITWDKQGNIEKVKLKIGLTSYKDFIGTNMSPRNEEILRAGSLDHDNCQAYMADPIGVGALIQTRDKHFIFIERSDAVAEYPGKICRPGGHPEPDDVTEVEEMSLDLVDESVIVKELYDSVLKEIKDELNIPSENLSAPLMLGVGFNPETGNRPSFEFYVKCNLLRREVRELYAVQKQKEKFETTNLKLVSVEHLLMDNDSSGQGPFWDKLTHPAKYLGGQELWKYPVYELKRGKLTEMDLSEDSSHGCISGVCLILISSDPKYNKNHFAVISLY